MMTPDTVLTFLVPSGRVEVDAAHRAIDEDLDALLLGTPPLVSVTPATWIEDRTPAGEELADRLEAEFSTYEDLLGGGESHAVLLDWIDQDPDRRELRRSLLVEAAHFFVDELDEAIQWAVATSADYVHLATGDPALLVTIAVDDQQLDAANTHVSVLEEARRQMPAIARAAGVLAEQQIVDLVSQMPPGAWS